MDPDEVLNFGVYGNFKFNECDKHLREIGLYCEEIFPYEDFSDVLERLAKEGPPLPEFNKFAILPANEVIIDSNVSGRFALYMQVEGRLENKVTTPNPQ